MTDKNQADVIAEAVRVTWATMSKTDKAAIQSAVLRGRRKAITAEMKDLKKDQP
jgi:hypothetical protein